MRNYNKEEYLASLDSLLKAIKEKGLITFVTVSWTRPYNVCKEIGGYVTPCRGGENRKFELGGEIMDYLFHSEHLDYLSPQMYASGTETDDGLQHFHINYLNQVWGYDKFDVFC